MAKICKAKKSAQLSPHTHIEIECGISEGGHSTIHMTKQTVGDLSIMFVWPGEFRE